MKKELILIKFGERVRSERLKQKLSQERFAEIAGLHRTYIGMVERGEKNISLRNIAKLAGSLNVTIAQLVKGL